LKWGTIDQAVVGLESVTEEYIDGRRIEDDVVYLLDNDISMSSTLSIRSLIDLCQC